MNRIYIITLYALFIMSQAHAQQVGIGTTQPDASAALEIRSTDKGLLIPRVDLGFSPVTTPATGLMVFNTNSMYGAGIGLYINMGTGSAPQWMQLVPNSTGNFIRNQTVQQANSNFSISNSGEIGNALTVGAVNTGPASLVVQSASSVYTNLALLNNSSGTLWNMRTWGVSSGIPGAFSISNGVHTPILAVGGNVSINQSAAPTAALDVNGDIKASGNFLIGMQYYSHQSTVAGNTTKLLTLVCPAGYKLISGGGGHRDFNSAAKDIRLDYNGPDPSAPTTTWKIIAHNSSGSNRELIIYCNCAKVQ
ncbi:hypothetical protein A3860_10120 [Niastella vici]|uniref:Uncharacterized protein n=1 Tax=Niastella vici TaxID=1703345 RepID=A0A1V9FEY2_9BACT|nr:hypothetical protein [Niastella vici]OQP56923.1 hypothetical protein A3860_10120 [Niastella vici]